MSYSFTHHVRRMMSTLIFSALIGFAFLSTSALADEPGHYLVRDGKATSAIVYARASSGLEPSRHEKLAAQQLRYHVERAADVELPVIDASDIRDLPPDHTVIMIGGGAIAKWRGLPVSQINPGAYRVVSKLVGRGKDTRQYLFFQGRDTQTTTTKLLVDLGWAPQYNEATLWAVGYFLDRYLGVRWLWPGEEGTYVPKTDTIVVPPDLNVVKKHPVSFRSFRNGLGAVRNEHSLVGDETFVRIEKEARLWMAFQQMGSRSPYYFGHSFGAWWNKYHEEYPDIFAKLPEGHEQPYPNGGRVKLCLSNVKVDELVIKEWKAAGMPDVWNVCPNDGRGWCVCENCLAMDEPARYDSWEEVWKAPPPGGALSARYVRFWSRLLRKMRKLNPDVELASYAYSAYRMPPPKEVKVPEDGLVLQFVPGHWDMNKWKEPMQMWAEWSQRGVKLQLRPNWFHTGSTAPYLPLHDMGEFMRFAREQGMLGYNFDSLLGYWGVQSPLYYMVPRLVNRPDLSVNDVIDEYVSAFGDAAPAVRKYLSYWESASRKLSFKSTKNGFVALPQVVEEQHIREAYNILGRAKKLAADEDELVKKRVQFLWDGLRHMELTRQVLRIGNINTRPKQITKAAFGKLTEELWEMRRELTSRHVVWGGMLARIDERYKLPTTVGRAEADTYISGPFNSENKQRPVGSEVDASFSQWRFRKDPEKQGVEQEWYKDVQPNEQWRAIEVPSPWNYTWVGDYIGSAWYQVQFDIPATWKGKPLTLHFAGVDSEGWVYVNGKLVGEKTTESTGKEVGEIWDDPLSVKILSEQLHWDKPNVLYVRVTTPAGLGGIHGPVTVYAPQGK